MAKKKFDSEQALKSIIGEKNVIQKEETFEDLPKQEKRGRKTAEENLIPRTVYIDDPLFEELSIFSLRTKTNKSAVIRDAVREYLENHSK